MTYVDHETGKSFECSRSIGICLERRLEMLHRGNPLTAAKLDQPKCTVCVAQGGIEAERVFGSGFGELRQRRFIFAAQVQIRDREQRPRTGKARMPTSEILEPIDVLGVCRCDRTSETGSITAEEFLLTAHEVLVRCCIFSSEIRRPVLRLVCRAEKSWQNRGECAHRCKLV